MAADPYFVTQDNGAGAPAHFATTYRQLDMLHHLLNNGALVNQRDSKGFTPLHRAAYLAHYDGYLELYEYLLSRGADPSVRSEDYDPYLDPGRKTPVEVAQEEVREALLALEAKYASVPKAPVPHPDVGCWWTLYDYGLERVREWAPDYVHPYPEELKRARDKKLAAERKAEARKARAEGRPVPRKAGAAGVNAAKPADAATGASTSAAASAGAVDPSSPVAFLFPGQGSQALGMLSTSSDLPAVKAMLATAQEVLGYDLLELTRDGPKSKLDDTRYSQPALFVAGLAAVEKLRTEQGEAAVAAASATAGLSLGEYTALVFAGALTFEDALKVVKVRAESMAHAASLGDPHGMLSVVGLSDADIADVVAAVNAKLPDRVCKLANMLFPQGRVLSGHKDALEVALTLALEKGALKATPLAVSGAFHTELMAPAREALAAALETVEFHEPRIPVFSNVTGKPFENAADIKAKLPRQLVEPVRWEDEIRAVIAAGKNKLFELGPGQQIKAMVRRIDQGAFGAFKNVHA